jgi:hypothetical protein
MCASTFSTAHIDERPDHSTRIEPVGDLHRAGGLGEARGKGVRGLTSRTWITHCLQLELKAFFLMLRSALMFDLANSLACIVTFRVKWRRRFFACFGHHIHFRVKVILPSDAFKETDFAVATSPGISRNPSRRSIHDLPSCASVEVGLRSRIGHAGPGRQALSEARLSKAGP